MTQSPNLQRIPDLQKVTEIGATTTEAVTISGALNADGDITNTSGDLTLDATSNIIINTDLETDQWLSSDFNTIIGVGAVGSGNLAHAAGNEGWYNTGYGGLVFEDITTGEQNVAFGYNSLSGVTTGKYNTGLGQSSLAFTTDGEYNTAVGLSAGYFNVNGDNNTFIGLESGYSATGNTLNNNTLVGFRTGHSLLTGGDGNILFGYQAGDNLTTATQCLIIGYDLNGASATADYQLNIGGVIGGFTSGGAGEVEFTLGDITVPAGVDLDIVTTDSPVKIGTGSPGVATAAGDLYVQGNHEVDGISNFGGTATFNGIVCNTNLQFGINDYLRSDETVAGAIVMRNGNQTAHPIQVATGSTNILEICEWGDKDTDFGHAAFPDPTLVLQSSDATTIAENMKLSFITATGNGTISTAAGGIDLQPTGDLIFTAGAAQKVDITATAAAHTDTTGLLDIDILSGATGVVGIDLAMTAPAAGLGAGESMFGYNSNMAGDDGDNATSNIYCYQATYTPNTSSAISHGFYAGDTDLTYGLYTLATAYFGSGQQVNRTAVTASTTTATASYYFGCDTLGADTITLQTADTVAGRIIIVKDEGGNAAAQNITVDTQGGETIDGNATDTLNVNYQSRTYISDGTNWFII
jgi:hypothetical protein